MRIDPHPRAHTRHSTRKRSPSVEARPRKSRPREPARKRKHKEPSHANTAHASLMVSTPVPAAPLFPPPISPARDFASMAQEAGQAFLRVLQAGYDALITPKQSSKKHRAPGSREKSPPKGASEKHSSSHPASYDGVNWRARKRRHSERGREFVESVISQYFRDKKRFYGIELELRNITQQRVGEALFQTFGGVLSSHYSSYQLIPKRVGDLRIGPIHIETEDQDGTSYPEIISPKLRWKHIPEYSRMLPALKRYGALGSSVRNPIGIHIHGTMDPTDLRALATLGANYYGNVELISEYFAPYSSRYQFIQIPPRGAIAKLLELQSKPTYLGLKKWFKDHMDGQLFQLNLVELFNAHPRRPLQELGLERRRTAEFRVMNTMLSADFLVHSAKFVNAMLNAAEEGVLLTHIVR